MLALVTVVTPGTAHSKTLVKCNFCDMKFSAITSRLAAHLEVMALSFMSQKLHFTRVFECAVLGVTTVTSAS